MLREHRTDFGVCDYILRKFLLAVLVLTFGPLVFPAPAQSQKAPPKTRTDNIRDVVHGVEIVDPYRWLEDQESPETRAWINAQNEYTESLLGSFPGREQLKQRLTQLMKIETIGTPIERNGRYFFAKRQADQDLFVIYMREGLRGKDEALIDPHPWSSDHTTSVTLLGVSQDGTLLAYGMRQGGEDEVTVNLFDVDGRKDLPDRLPKARYFSLSFKPDKSGFYYSRYRDEGPRLYYHAMGSDPAVDKEIFGKGYSADKTIAASLSEDGRYLLISVFYGAGAHRSEIYIQDLAAQGPIVPIVNDLNAMFSGQIAGDHLFLQTNWEAPNWRIFDVDLKNPARDRWREIIPAGDAVITGFSLAGGKLFVNYLQNVTSRVKVFEPDGTYVREIAFPTIGSVSGVSGRWRSNEAFYSFASFHIPPTIYRYDIARADQEVWARLNVPIDSSTFEVKQVWYESKDGTKVPMFIVHGKGIKLDGSNPTLLTGYGGFNISLTPSFSARAALWVESGGVFAVPNLRGGGEFGEKWHRAGMLEKKQNVFDDFIAAAEWLITNRYTNPSKLAISGGSNGGLLVGAALTQRPDLFQAVVCSYPLLDMVRYHKFLVGRFWIPEYGSSDDPEQFTYIHAYSPYHQVRPGTKYPAVLFITGDADTRVAPLHARKMAARLQAATGSERPILLRYDTKAGHSGGLPLSKQIEDLTEELSFLFWQLGVKSSAPVSQTSQAHGTEILWDTWGVPHIFAKDLPGLFYAFGWAQMQSHGNLLLRLYGQARGRGAEYWGKDYLEADRWVRTMGIPTLAEQWYQAQTLSVRDYLDAFVAGINAYAREHPGQIADDVKMVLPVLSTDVLAHVQRVIHLYFVARLGALEGAKKQWEQRGSNAWAVGPRRSASGRALLLANPHLPWSDFFVWYEAQLTAPGLNAYGAALIGQPILGIAFNDYLGWTHTVNTHDGADLYELTLAEGGYRWDGGVRPFETEEQTIKVKQPDGTLREEKLVVRRSVHGPVIAEKSGKALALRVVGFDQPGLFEQYVEMMRATNLNQFEAALKRLQLPMFTVMYADRDGHIMHLFGGRTPIRPKGPWNWAGIVPGDTSATLWTATHPYEDLPRVVDPPSGWLQNANDPPWTTTFPPALNPNDFPPYMAPRFMHFRAQRSARMLAEDEKITFEEFVQYKHSTRMELADRILDDLIPAARQRGSDLARQAADVLEKWDRSADAESRGAVLFQAFYREMARRSGNTGPFAVKWSESSPLNTPDGLADPAAAVSALEAAAERVKADYGALDVPWGQVHRLRRAGVDLPANGGPGELGIFRVVGFEKAADGRFEAVGGDSYVCAIEFSTPPRALALTSYGSASQPGSPHLADQLKLFARKELRPVWRTRQEIEAHLEARKIFE